MAGINDFKGQIRFIVEAAPYIQNRPTAVEAVLKGIWEQTVAYPDLGAKIGKQIVDSLPTGTIYRDPYSVLFSLILRGWAKTTDPVLEKELAQAIHSTRWGDSARGKIAELFTEFLKGYAEGLRSASGVPRTVAEVEHKDKLVRFITSAGDSTQSPCIKVAANAYHRYAAPSEIRSLFVR